MNTPTFKEQFDKITRAYFNNELDPCDNCACFIGNLLNGTWKWTERRRLFRSPIEPTEPGLFDPYYNFYTMEEICQMEENFLGITEMVKINEWNEESIFQAMDSTLDMLRKIHESKGEVIESFEFKQRQLA